MGLTGLEVEAANVEEHRDAGAGAEHAHLRASEALDPEVVKAIRYH